MLIISNPLWEVGGKELLLANNVVIVELGYFITDANLVKATHDIAMHLRSLLLGYVYRTTINVHNSINYIDNYSIGKVDKASVSTLDEGKPRCNQSSVETSLKKGGLLESVKHKLKGLLSWVRPSKGITKRFTFFQFSVRAISVKIFQMIAHFVRYEMRDKYETAIRKSKFEWSKRPFRRSSFKQ
jgi:hypothetical protein